MCNLRAPPLRLREGLEGSELSAPCKPARTATPGGTQAQFTPHSGSLYSKLFRPGLAGSPLPLQTPVALVIPPSPSLPLEAPIHPAPAGKTLGTSRLSPPLPPAPLPGYFPKEKELSAEGWILSPPETVRASGNESYFCAGDFRACSRLTAIGIRNPCLPACLLLPPASCQLSL